MVPKDLFTLNDSVAVTFDLFDWHCDGPNGLHTFFPINVTFVKVRGWSRSVWTDLKGDNTEKTRGRFPSGLMNGSLLFRAKQIEIYY